MIQSEKSKVQDRNYNEIMSARFSHSLTLYTIKLFLLIGE